jgi:predicted secreted protein
MAVKTGWKSLRACPGDAETVLYQEPFVKKLFFVLIPAALLLFSCQQTPTPTGDLSGITDPRLLTAVAQTLVARPTPSAAELEVTDPAKTIEVAAGSEFHITVAKNLSEDYHWELAQALDPNIVQYVWKDEAPKDPKDPNSTGKDIWRFKALAPGKTTITLGYYEGMTVNAAQTPVFTVVVK